MAEETSEQVPQSGPASGAVADDPAWQRYVRDRDPDAFAHIVHNYYGLVYSVCRRHLGDNLSSVEDVVQETFCKLAANADTIQSHLAAWIHNCARNAARQAMRAERSRRRRETKWAAKRHQGPPTRLNELTTELDDAVQSLDELDQMLVIEHYLVGRTQTELATQIGVTPSAVNKRLQSALEQLRYRLAQIGVTLTISSLASSLSSKTAEAVLTASLQSSILDAVSNAKKATSSPKPWRSPLQKISSLTWIVIGLVLFCLSIISIGDFLASHPPTLVGTRTLTAIGGGHAGDSFGQAIVSDGEHLLIAAPLDNGAGMNAGAVFAFQHDGDQWTPTQKILAPVGESSSFGGAVAIDGETLVVGAFGQLLTPVSAPRLAKLIEGDSGFIGRRHFVSPRIAAVQIYQRELNKWTHAQSIETGEPSVDSGFGAAVAIADDHLLVSAPYKEVNGHNEGVVYAYEREGESWSLSGQIRTSSPPQRLGNGFGATLAMDSDYATIGEWNAWNFDEVPGALHVFQLVDGDWQRQQTLLPPDDARIGQSVDFDGKTLVIGAQYLNGEGSVQVFGQVNGIWELEQVLQPAEDSDKMDFGTALVIRDDLLIIGAKFASSAEIPHCGAAFIYSRQDGEWVRAQVLRPTAAEPLVAFGDAIAITENSVVIGSAGGYHRVVGDESTKPDQPSLSVLQEYRNRPGRAFTFRID